MNYGRIILLLSAIAVMAPLCPAQVPEEPATAEEASFTEDEDNTILLRFPENVEVKLLIDYISERMGINILCDQVIGKKQITIIAPMRIPTDSLMGWFETILKIVGLAMIDADQPGWKRIVENNDLLSITGDFQQDSASLTATPDAKPIAQVFLLKHVLPDAADKAIQPFMSKPGGKLFRVSGTDMIIVSDYGANLKRISTVLELVDRPGKKVTVRFVPVEHRNPADLAKQVTDLLSAKDRVRGPKRPAPLALVPLDDRIAVVFTADAEADALELMDLLDVPEKTETRNYRFQHVLPQRIDGLIRKLISFTKLKETYNSVIDEESGLLIVEAPEKVHERIASLLKELDVAPDIETRKYQFMHIDPSRVERLVNDMIEDPAVLKLYKSTTDAESGLLIVSAPLCVHEQITSLKEQLDRSESAAEFGQLRFYKLMNTTAGEVLATIQAMDFGEEGMTGLTSRMDLESASNQAGQFTGPNSPPSPAGSEPPAPPMLKTAPSATTQPTEKGTYAAATTVRKKNASVTADTNTNTIIVIAQPPVQKIYEKLISVLDKRRPQVMIEVTLVTMDTSNDFSMGIEVSRHGQIGSEAQYLTFSSFGLSAVAPATGRLAMNPGVGFNATLLSSDVADVVIRALASTGRTDVLSAPRILVNDNASATLTSQSGAPFTSVNASTTVATTSFAGYAQAGTSVSVTPHISEGDYIQLEYSVTLSSFTGEGSAGIPPPRQENTINSKVTVPDGNAVIVGGLARKDSSESITKVPILGDIPLLGYLFSSRTKNAANSTLFVFIRPVILRDDQFEDLKYLSRSDRELARLPSDYPSSGPVIME
ncbi:MAG: hypothetical protein HQ546_08505 [Planctomycetes bacterium]|nr:hypothetical protein [Planctomycetota bacterium]